jgi:hypothetical protein
MNIILFATNTIATSDTSDTNDTTDTIGGVVQSGMGTLAVALWVRVVAPNRHQPQLQNSVTLSEAKGLAR